MADLSGRKLGKYQLIERLGRGGMAEVYKAHQPSLDRFVAVKMILEAMVDDEEFVQRFQREAQIVAQLRHPHILQVIDFDVDDDLHYMVMEYIQGKNLKQYIQANGPLAQEDMLRIAWQMADALTYAHQMGMVHRDIKPANIMFTDDTYQHAVLTDFGIARMVNGSHMTRTGMLLGTPAYLSPEAARGEATDGRADIYSLGVLMYKMLTGQVPFDADTPLAIILKQVSEPLPPVSKFGVTLHPAVESVMLRALMKEPDERYPDAAALRTALEQAQQQLEDRVSTAPSVVKPQAAVATPQQPPAKPKREPTVVQPFDEEAVATNSTSTTTIIQSPSTTRAMWGIAAAVFLLALAIAGFAFTEILDDDDADSNDPSTAVAVVNTPPPPRNGDRPPLSVRGASPEVNRLFNQAMQAVEAEDWEAALSTLDRAVALQTLPRLLEVRSSVHQNLENFEEALADISQAIALDSTKHKFFEIRGHLLLELDEPEEALTDFQRADRLDPNDPDILVSLGQAHYWLEEFGRAQTVFEAALEQDRNQAGAYFGLARIAIENDEPRVALAHIDEALELEGDNPDYRVVRATLLLQLDRADEALETIADVNAIMLAEPEALFQMSEVLDEFGLDEEAETLTCVAKATAEEEDPIDVCEV